MSKTVILFAGQGSQYNNMGLDFVDKSSDARSIFNIAKRYLNFDILEVLGNDSINETLYTQPLTLLTSILIYSEVKKFIKPDALLGFSLGEYTAFYEAGIFNLVDTLNIVQARSKFMSDASKLNKGSMQAIIGLDSKTIEQICNEVTKPNFEVSIANYNEPKQTVISGNPNAVKLVANKCMEQGARRTIQLNVSGAFHTSYMASAGIDLERYINDEVFISKPNYPVWLNSTGLMLENADIAVVAKMQVQSPVMFMQAIKDLVNKGYTNFVEIGPGRVLSGLVKKIDSGVNIININKYEDLIKLKEFEQNEIRK